MKRHGVLHCAQRTLSRALMALGAIHPRAQRHPGLGPEER